MEFSRFEKTARAIWEEIPEQYKAGVDGLVVDRAVVESADRAEVYTMGECVTEDYPSAYGGPDTIRSAVVLYYGSFREIAGADVAFDWPNEIRETIMHELQHHLESLARQDELEDFDYAVEQNFKRLDGEPFDPWFFRAGELLEPNLYRVEQDVFYEVLTLDRAPAQVDFDWQDGHYRLAMPRGAADVTFFVIENIPCGEGEFNVVRVVRRGLLATLRAAFGGGYSSAQTGAQAERL